MHNEVLKVFVKEDPEALLALFNLCWGNSAFPARWKRARLVLLLKGETRQSIDPSSYRSISLVDTVAKLYERLILHRLETELSECGGLSIRQFGFRRGIGITDAINRVLELTGKDRSRERHTCILISLDLRNAFNTASWRSIDDAIRRKRLPRRLVEIMRAFMSQREN